MSRLGARVALTALALLLVAGASPLAAADHTFAHRYIIYGKVVDSRGYAVPNLTVEMRYDPAKTAFAPEQQISSEQQPGTRTDAFGPTFTKARTNAHGEFIFAYHVHGISQALPGTYFLGATGSDGNISFKQEFPFDPHFRVDFHAITLDHEDPTAVRDDSFVVEGRFFIPSSEPHSMVDGAPGPMYGETVHNQPVNITFEHDGVTERFNTTSNNYGDFAVRVPLAAPVASGKITVESDGKTMTKDYDAKLGVSTFKVEVPKPADPFVRGALIVLGVVVVAAVVIGTGVVGYRRMSARREADQVRAVAMRKRSR